MLAQLIFVDGSRIDWFSKGYFFPGSPKIVGEQSFQVFLRDKVELKSGDNY